MALYYDVRVDVTADKVIDSGYHFTAGDSEEIYLRVAVMNGNVKYNAENVDAVRIHFRKADGTFVEGTPEASGDVWIYQFLGNEIQAPGKVLCDIKFFYESGRVSSGKFTFMVDSDTADGTIIQSTGYIASLEEAKQQATALVGDITGEYDTARGYSETATSASLESRSYAKGGTGQREGEDTDNSKYYMQQTQLIKEEAEEYVSDFKYTHVRYSENADGTDFVAVPTVDTIYTGIYTGTSSTAPESKAAYQWVRNRGFDGNAYWATFDVNDGELEMTYNTDLGTIEFNVNESTGDLEVTI